MNAQANTENDVEVLDFMPAQRGFALSVPQENPYLAMASRALDMGKVDQLDKLLDLQMRWDAEQARKAFVSAMADFKTEAGGITIAKSKRVSFTTQKGKTEYDHAELHDITRALVSVLAKHGLSHRWVPSQDASKITVTCVMTHRDGHSESVSLTAAPDDSGGKNSIQSIASTKTYLERYTLLAATGVATGGEIDNDGRSVDPVPDLQLITEEQEIVLRDLMDAYVSKKDEFLKWVSGAAKMPVAALSEIPADTFDMVHAQLKKLRDKKLGGAQ